MAAPAIASLMPFFTLTNGMAIRITALNPTTGAEDGNVAISAIALSVDQEDDDGSVQAVKLDPAFLPGAEAFV